MYASRLGRAANCWSRLRACETRDGLEELDLVMQDYVKQPYELC